jgi:Terminase large subunit, T4likevirus-type, N-terminal
MTKRSTKTPTIIDVIHNRHLFGSLPAFTTVETWTAWIVWLKAIFALPMDGRELAIYRRCTGRDDSPAVEPTEAYTVVGRRGGKSFISALTAVFVACFREYRQYLNAGEQAVVLVLARDRDQAKIVFRYIKGIIAAIPPLHAMVINETADGVELDNGVMLMVKTSDFRAIRGLTIALCVADEAAFWDGQGVNPDKEIFTALRPAMATIRGSKLLCISTAYAKAGVLFEAYREYYGQQSDHAFVWQADTRTMNPTLDQKLIERELEKDPESARAEWLGVFREDLEAAFTLEAIEACVIRGRDELPPSRSISYRGFVDPSGGRRDAYTLAIGHRERDKAVIDLLRAWSAPFDPELVTAEASELLKKYGVVSVCGDSYSGEWSVSAFRKHGVDYQKAPKNRSEIYLDFIAPINARLVELPENRTLVDQLRRLERRRGRLGKDQIDHPANGHDDVANAAAGCSWLILNDEKEHGINAFKLLVTGAWERRAYA